MSDYSIGEAAAILNVTTRTLRHWDTIGLLCPQWRSLSGDYRIYTDDDLAKGFQILVYREAGLSLKKVSAILNDSVDRHQSLVEQRRILKEKIATLHRMVRAVDVLMKEDRTMQKDIARNLFGPEWEGWQQEAESRWGETQDWEQSQKVIAEMDHADVEAAQAEHARFCSALRRAYERGIDSGSEEAAELVALHAATIQRWYDVTLSKQILLSKLYVCDAKFHAMYGGKEVVEFFHQLVSDYAKAQGLDPEQATWE